MTNGFEVSDLAERRRSNQRKKYADLVLQAYDDLEHEDARAIKEKKAEVERNARSRL